MILQDKTTGKKVQLDLDEITLKNLKDSANMICLPNQQYVERVLTVTFPTLDFNAEESSVEEILEIAESHSQASCEQEKLYEEISQEVTEMMEIQAENGLLFGSDKKLPTTDIKPKNFTQIFLQGLGNLIINRI